MTHKLTLVTSPAEAFVTGGDRCCYLACDAGACETCPCCAAGWCVFGVDGLPEDSEAYADWLVIAAEHNPIVANLVALTSRVDAAIVLISPDHITPLGARQLRFVLNVPTP